MIQVPFEHKLSVSLSDLSTKIADRGFEISSVKFDKKSNKYVAIAKREEKEVRATGNDVKMALANLLNAVAHTHIASIQVLARWQHTFETQLKEIAEAYAKAPAYEKKAAAAFMELAAECSAKGDAIRSKLDIEIVHEPTPYMSADKMHEDVRKRRKLRVSDIGSNDHPLWTRNQVIDYRICLDVLGYTAANAEWDWNGTNMAFAAFAAVVSELAQKALFSELLGQTAYASYFRAYGPAKICLLNKLFDDVAEKENPHKGFRGIHPSQLLLPTELPEATPKFSKTKKTEVDENGVVPRDINEGYSTSLEHRPTVHYPTEYSDFLNLRGAGDVLDGLHTDWADSIHDDQDEAHIRQEWRSYQKDDPQGAQRISHAVANAITAAFMLEDSTTGHGAIKYQALYDKISDDPHQLMQILHDARNAWNTERFGPQSHDEHRPWVHYDAKGDAPLARLAALLYDKDPQMSIPEAHKEAERLVHQMHARFEETAQEGASDKDQPDDEREWEIEREANKMVMKWLDTVTDAKGRFDHHMPHASAAEVDPIAPHKYDDSYGPDNHRVFNLQRFPATRTKNVQMIARLMKHLDRIIEEALVDVHNHDGKGNHFRSYILSLEDDINPKTVGFMWLLLAPYTSQLSMIDETMTGALGHHSDDKSARDYLLHERMLMAHRDDMGLGHIPLGHFNMALNGAPPEGAQKSAAISLPEHQDLSCFRVIDPTPAWKVKLLPKHDLIYQFGLTPHATKDIEDEWNNTIAPKFAPNQIPYKKQSPKFMAVSRVSSKMQRYRDRGMSVQDVWNKIDELEPEVDYHSTHAAPGPDFGTQLHDSDSINTGWFPDFYARPNLYSDSGNREPYDAESQKAMMQYQNQPDAGVPIYRAGPKGEINQGDWVTLSPSYALQHSYSNNDNPAEDMPIWTTSVPAHTLWTDGNSINEWGYHGPSVRNPDIWRKQGSVKTADKLHDFLMNPKSRPDLQTPEGQHLLEMLHEYHSPKVDQLMPWLAREWKKGRLADTPEKAGFTPDMPLYHTLTGSLLYRNPDDRTGWSPLSLHRLNHWADFMNSNHPLKREMGDIMQHHIPSFHQRIEDWEAALAEAEEQEAASHGEIVHTTPDNWTIRKLTEPKELDAEGNNMGHCVGSYANDVSSGKSQIYSLRDPKGAPHATIEVEPKMVRMPPHDAVENFLRLNPIGRALPPDQQQALRDYHANYMKGYDAGDPYNDDARNPPPASWPSVGNVHAEIIKKATDAIKPHDYINNGTVVQIQGKENKEPIDEYKQRIRHWFETLPHEERPVAQGKLGGDGAWEDEDITHPEDIQDWHLQPNPINEYGLPVKLNPDWDKLVTGTMYPPYGNSNLFDPSFDYEHGQRVYELAKAHGQIPQLAHAVADFSDEVQNKYDIDMYPEAYDYAAPDQNNYFDDEGNFDRDRYDEDHQKATDMLMHEWYAEQPEYQALEHFNTNLRQHWNPTTYKYENGTFS